MDYLMMIQGAQNEMLGELFQTVAGRDAGVERTGMYLQRV
jgi:hypothetical protein